MDPFFEQCLGVFPRAATQPTERFYRVAGFLTRVRFAKASFVPLFHPSLSHLEEKPSRDVALTISLFDSSLISLCPPWGKEAYSFRGELLTPASENYQAVFSIGSGFLSLLKQDEAICWAKDLSKTPYWERGAPFLSIFHLWLRKKGVQIVHAAAVGKENGDGVLLVGTGGSGKSTTALSCLLRGMCYVSDDYCALSNDTVHSLFSSGKVDPFSKTLLSLGPFQSEDEKELLFLQGQFPHLMRSSLLVRAVLVPKVTQGKTSLSRISSAEALRALAPSSISQLPYAGAEVFSSLASTLRNLPCYRLNLSQNIDENVALLQLSLR
jgi:hypothetical protein